MPAKPNPMHCLRDAWSGRLLYVPESGASIWLRNGREPVNASALVVELVGLVRLPAEAHEEPPSRAPVPYIVTERGEEVLMSTRRKAGRK